MNKKYFAITILFVLMLSMSIAIVGCAPNGPETPSVPTLSTSLINLTTGGQATITVNDQGENSVTWLSTNPTVAKVDGGVVTAMSAGNATINATVGEYVLTCTVKVDMIDATILLLNSNGVKQEENKTALYLNQTYTFTPVLVKGASTISLEGLTISYYSTDSETVSVENVQNGVKVSALKLGSANVWASVDYEGVTYTSKKIEVKVKNSTELVLSRDSFTFVTSEDLQGNPVTSGSTSRLYVSYRNLETNEVIPVSKNDITFKVLDEGIASVDSWGNLMGKEAGQTTLKVYTEYGEAEVDIAVSYPIFSAEDLDTIALATYNMSVTKASKFLSSTFILMNDIDYDLHQRNYMLPIASLNAQSSMDTVRDLYLDRDVPRYGEADGTVSYYSKAWKEILNLTEGYTEFIVTSSAEHEDASQTNPVTIQAKRLYKQNGDAFEGINPYGVKFTGVIDGNGYSIKNAWLMLDNYLVGGGFIYVSSLSPAFMSGFIGYQAGTVKNISFDNLSIGDTQTIINNGKYQPTSRRGNWGSFANTVLEAYTGELNADKSQSVGYNLNSRSAYRFYTEKVSVDGKEKAESFKRGIVCLGYRNERESSANALFIHNEGKIENVKMSYVATGTISDTNNNLRADGLVLVNDGSIKNSIVERRVFDNSYVKLPQAGRVVYLNRLNGSVENLYLTTNGIGNEISLNTKGFMDLTVCASSSDLLTTVNGLDSSIWNGTSLIKGCVFGA